MPSIMIHLLAAYKINADADPLFYIGAVAPDAVKTREEKDITHFRIAQDREKALADLAKSTRNGSYFDEGILLHLFLDWHWDKTAFNSYACTHTDENWFSCYRHEIAKASSHIYHSAGWSGEIWSKILSVPKESYGKAPGVSYEELEEFIKRNHKWHSENKTGQSEVYIPSYVEEFIDNAVESFCQWRKGIAEKFENMGA